MVTGLQREPRALAIGHSPLCRQPRRRSKPGVALGAIALLLILLGAGATPPAMMPLHAVISSVTSKHGFDLMRWEIGAIAEGVVRQVQGAVAVRGLDGAARRRLVEEYFRSAGLASGLHGERDAVATRDHSRDDKSQAVLAARVTKAEQQQTALVAAATEIIAGQIREAAANRGIDTALLDLQWRRGLPPLSVNITPPVFFRFSELPLLLVVAPRNKIAVTDNRFLSPNMTVGEMARIESQIDQQGVSSIVLPIGGFAAYPSMIPSNWSLKQTLQVVAHEWTHHYLSMHPLGQHYFSSYALRSINETVADIAGNEIGDEVYELEYQAAMVEPPVDRAMAAGQPPALDFNKAMLEIRQAVEGMLLREDVNGAEQLMADRKVWLTQNGYYLRKLNTAYLTFFGAYAGSGNSYEPKLRRLREQSASLGDFLRKVQDIASESDFAVATLGS